MPGNNPSPNIALMTRIDARQWAGVALWERSPATATVTLPSTATYYEDAISLASGRGSKQVTGTAGMSLAVNLAAGATAAGATGTWTCGLTSADLFYVQVSGAGSGAFTITAAGNPSWFGFTTTPLAATNLGGGVFRATAQGEWTRGVSPSAYFKVDSSTTANDFVCPGQGAGYATEVPHNAQDLVTMLRVRGLADADDLHATTCLEYLDNAANAVASIRWGINSSGQWYRSWDNTTATGTVSWLSTTFRDALGFSGSETAVASGNLSVLTATYPGRHVWAPDNQIRNIWPRFHEDTSAMRMPNGGIAAATLGQYHGWDVEVFLDGPQWDTPDDMHIFRRWWRNLPRGVPVNVYQEFGDPRRQLYTDEVTATQVAYDTLYTSERRRGRLRCVRDPDDTSDRTANYIDPEYEQTGVVAIRLTELV